MKLLEAQFQNQPRDTSWAVNTRQELQLAIDNLKLTNQDYKADAIECREGMCKIEVSDRSEEQSQDFLMDLMAKVSDSLSQVTVNNTFNEDGTIESTYYLSN